MDQDNLVKWSIAVIETLARLGLDSSLTAMLEANVRSPNKKVLMGTAQELARMVLDLPPQQRSLVDSAAPPVAGISAETLVARMRKSLGNVLSRKKVSSEADARLLQEALNDDELSDEDAERARMLLQGYLVKVRPQ